MKIFSVPSLEHNLGDHPENARRVPAILAVVEKLGVGGLRFADHKAIAPVSRDQLAAVHDVEYIAALEEAMSRAPAYIDYAPTYITPQSFACAARAAGAAIAAVECVFAPAPPEGPQAFALIRPPGHHARPSQAMGFCLFNNVALAARRAQALGARKVMIVDFDVHHGNGTQQAFYADPSVLFISTHQRGLYPLTGDAAETGDGEGQGYTINVPLAAGAGDAAFQRIIGEIFWPAAERFKLDVLLVSAGYDAHWRDPLAALQLSCKGYHALGSALADIAQKYCGGRIVFVLEGGYDLAALAHGVANTILGALHQPAADPLGPPPRAEADAGSTIASAKKIHHLE